MLCTYPNCEKCDYALRDGSIVYGCEIEEAADEQYYDEHKEN